jgi:predicted NAD/FAD-binding protein
MKVAIVGSGIAGLAAAHHCATSAAVTLFEAGGWFGGHTHTSTSPCQARTGARCTASTPASWSSTRHLPATDPAWPTWTCRPRQVGHVVLGPGAERRRPLEWSGTSLSTVFAQRGNLLRPRFWRMLRDLLRFNALATRIAREGSRGRPAAAAGAVPGAHRFSRSSATGTSCR